MRKLNKRGTVLLNSISILSVVINSTAALLGIGMMMSNNLLLTPYMLISFIVFVLATIIGIVSQIVKVKMV